MLTASFLCCKAVSEIAFFLNAYNLFIFKYLYMLKEIFLY